MKSWTAERVADAARGRLLRPPGGKEGPATVTIDSRSAGPGALFVGLPGSRVDGGRFAGAALAGGSWGVLIAEDHAEEALRQAPVGEGGAILLAEEPLLALQWLATEWRRHLRARVIGVTGSTGKTSTKDLLLAVLSPQRSTFASRGNFNTEIGLPLEILAAPEGTEVLVLEMGMRGRGQIAELARIAEPDVAVIVSIGPVHLELLGSIDAIAATKAELIAGLRTGGTAVIPADEALLDPHRRHDVRTLTFGERGDVRPVSSKDQEVEILVLGDRIVLEVDFTQAHLRRNLLAAVAAAEAIGVRPEGRVELRLSPGRGQREQLAGDITLIDDCYNANPMSMRAALDELAAVAAKAARQRGAGRMVAVLGDMLELGPEEKRFHEEVGAYARALEVDVLLTVGELARAMAPTFGGESHHADSAANAAALAQRIVRAGDVVLVKASRGVGLEVVCESLRRAAVTAAVADTAARQP